MRRTSIRHRREQGFTLIELVVAMGLLAVAVTAVYQLQAKNLDLQIEARFMTIASQIAKARFAGISCLEELTDGTETGFFEDENGEATPYEWEETVEEVMDHEGLYRVRVRVFVRNEAGDTVNNLVSETLLYRFKGES